MEMAEKLIREGKAYVDDTKRDTVKLERKKGTPSKCRDNAVDENMRLWKEMICGSQRGQECFLRGKLDMEDRNKTLRDPVTTAAIKPRIIESGQSTKYIQHMILHARLLILLKVSPMHFDLVSIMTVTPNITGFRRIWALGRFIYMSLAG